MRRIIGIQGVSGNDRVEERSAAVRLRAKDAAQTLRLLLAGTKRAGNLDGHGRAGQIHREVGHLGHSQHRHLTVAELLVELLARGVAGLSVDDGNVQLLGDLLQLIQVCADDQRGLIRMHRHDLAHHLVLGGRGGGQAVLVRLLGGGVHHPFCVRELHAHLGAIRGGDPALGLDVLPRCIEALRPDEAEHVTFAAVLAHQGGGQSEPAPGLQVTGHAENGCGQQVDFVIDDQAPVAGIEQLQRPELALRLARDHLVRRDRDGANFLALAGVLANLVLCQRGTADQLVLPLPAGHSVGHQDQRGGLGLGHAGRTHHRLACAAGKNHHAGATFPKAICGHLLVIAQLPLLQLLAELDVVRLAVHVSREVLGGPTHFEQLLLEAAAL